VKVCHFELNSQNSIIQLGLKWDDIDWTAGQVHVNRTYNHFRFYEPKSKASKRKVDIPPQTIQLLKKWNLACSPNQPCFSE